MELKNQFTKELQARNEQAKAIGCGVSARAAQTIELKGGAETARYILSREACSENFEKLAKAGRLDLSMEALVVERKYAALFADEEVNACFTLLCDKGYYVI